MIKSVSLAAASIAAAIATAAAAQSTPPPAPVTSARASAAFERPAGFDEQLNSARMREANANQSPRRVRRAERAAEMINAGNCAGAETMARQEGDGRLADTIHDVCKTPPAAPPAN